MSKTRILAAGLVGAVSLAGTASADFVGWYFDSYAVSVSGSDYLVIDAFAQMDDAADTVLNVFNSNISNVNGSAFHHNDFSTLGGQPGSWEVQLSANLPEIGLVPANDSFVLIGGSIGSSNTTSLDPSFTPATAPVPPANAGWFNSSPPNLQGRVDPGTLRTWVGRFVRFGVDTSECLSFAANLGYNQGLDTPVQFAYDDGEGSGPTIFVCIPAPAAVAVFGVAGLPSRRRRCVPLDS